ncbi:MAG: OprO/OprP family phosphate-selective porin [Gemmataceae bacterium]|nr:OprO/OprP family phosphate-selective porin [Gemmataceae bacterium]
MRPRPPRPILPAVFAGLAWLLLAPAARGQEALPPPAGVEDRLRALEAMNRQLAGEIERLTRDRDDPAGRLLGRSDPPADGVDLAAGEAESPVPDYTEGQFAPFTPPPGFPETTAAPKKGRFPLRASFGPGFRLESEDERFQLTIHYESQIEGRAWSPDDQLPANSGFFLPRQRFFFSGHITKPVEYELALNRGLGGINLLNAFLNFHLDDRFQVRIGRAFTPFSYDQYAVSNYWLLTPERSLFVTNLSPNRQIGAMAWGYLFDQRLDYAAGAFNGSRNSFESPDNALDFVGYVNARPFQNQEAVPAARFLNVGTSVAVGRQDQSPVPVAFRVGAGSPDANIPGAATVPFLILNPGVREKGDRVLGSVHAAYFVKGLSLIGEWQCGYGGYTPPGRADETRVPFGGFYTSVGYFLTGEEVERRTRVVPLRPLIPTARGQRRGFGAWEPTARVSRLRLGEDVFTAGLADRSVWSNSATTTELGVNWYWNEYVKFYLFWLHAEFGDPVQYRPGRLQKSADLLWVRAQLYF